MRIDWPVPLLRVLSIPVGFLGLGMGLFAALAAYGLVVPRETSPTGRAAEIAGSLILLSMCAAIAYFCLRVVYRVWSRISESAIRSFCAVFCTLACFWLVSTEPTKRVSIWLGDRVYACMRWDPPTQGPDRKDYQEARDSLPLDLSTLVCAGLALLLYRVGTRILIQSTRRHALAEGDPQGLSAPGPWPFAFAGDLTTLADVEAFRERDAAVDFAKAILDAQQGGNILSDYHMTLLVWSRKKPFHALGVVLNLLDQAGGDTALVEQFRKGPVAWLERNAPDTFAPILRDAIAAHPTLKRSADGPAATGAPQGAHVSSVGAGAVCVHRA